MTLSTGQITGRAEDPAPAPAHRPDDHELSAVANVLDFRLPALSRYYQEMYSGEPSKVTSYLQQSMTTVPPKTVSKLAGAVAEERMSGLSTQDISQLQDKSQACLF